MDERAPGARGSREAARSLVAPEGQGVTFVELFFDLVFVFAFTEVTGLVGHHLTPLGIARGALVFWLIWWAWTQFTWALNGADTTHARLRAGTLVATAVAFLMAVSVGQAFDPGGALLFVVPYVLVRLIGLGLYLQVSSADASWFQGVRVFGALSLLGLGSAVVGALVAPGARVWWWLGTIVLDLLASTAAGREDTWNLVSGHFAERHGLIVIIALGESLVAAAIPIASLEASLALGAVAVGAVALVCLLWWTYFGWFDTALEHELVRREAGLHAPFARDVYSLIHFPLITGVIGVAVGLEAMVAHPEAVLSRDVLIAFVAGLLLFLGSTLLIWLRAGLGVLLWRALAILVLPAVAWLAWGLGPLGLLASVCGGLLVLVVLEALIDPAPWLRDGELVEL